MGTFNTAVWGLCGTILTVGVMLASELGLAMPTRKSYVLSIKSDAHFDEVIAQSRFTFVKFFDPGCPHCQEMAASFRSLSVQLRTSSDIPVRVRTLEVDITRDSNAGVTERFHIDSIPMLYFIAHGAHPNDTVTKEVHTGQRTTAAMYAFVLNAVSVALAPPMPHFTGRKEVDAFTKLVGPRRALALLCLEGEGNNDSPAKTEWNILADAFRSDAGVKMATVSSTDLLYQQRFAAEFQTARSMYGHDPIAVVCVPFTPDTVPEDEDEAEGVSSATSEDAQANSNDVPCKHVRWYFPRVKDGESLSSFVYTTVVAEGAYITLSETNSRHILLADSLLLLVFGGARAPSPAAANALAELAATVTPNTSMVPVYVSVRAFPHVLTYVRRHERGGDPTPPARTEDLDETPLVFSFVGVNHGPLVRRWGAEKKAGIDSDVGQWAKQQVDDISKSLRSIATGGKLNELTPTTWRALLEYDKRNILLLLHGDENSDAYNKARTLMSDAATRLQEFSGFVVVASFVVSANAPIHGENSLAQLLSWINVTTLQPPAIVMVQPELPTEVYNEKWTVDGVTEFALPFTGIDDNEGEASTLSARSQASIFLFGVGVLLLASGLMALCISFMVQKRSVIWKMMGRRLYAASSGNSNSSIQEEEVALTFSHVKSG